MSSKTAMSVTSSSTSEFLLVFLFVFSSGNFSPDLGPCLMKRVNGSVRIAFVGARPTLGMRVSPRSLRGVVDPEGVGFSFSRALPPQDNLGQICYNVVPKTWLIGHLSLE
jgi:hypothetical protein